jgi:hypothetical protein
MCPEPEPAAEVPDAALRTINQTPYYVQYHDTDGYCIELVVLLGTIRRQVFLLEDRLLAGLLLKCILLETNMLWGNAIWHLNSREAW